MRVRKRLTVALIAVAATLGVALTGLYLNGAGRGTLSSAGSKAPARPAQPSRQPVPSRRAGTGPGWKLNFDPSFSGSKLNTSVWATCYLYFQPASGCTNFGNSDEYEWYLPSQDQVSAGVLHLVAQGIRTPGRNRNGAPKQYFCRSGMVTTYPSFRFEYGNLQVVARIPLVTGLWSAFWLVPAKEHWPPEIDIFEHYGISGTIVTFHPAQGPKIEAYPTTANLSAGWHTFGLHWTSSSLVWFIDGRKVMSINQHIPQEPMYFIADLADYTPPESGGCTGTLLIKSVRVWQ